MKNIANYLIFTSENRQFFHLKALALTLTLTLTLSLTTAALLAGCATPQPPVPKAVYDFGPSLQAPSTQAVSAPLPALVLAEIDALAALESTAVVYRLGYSDAQQLRPYTLARWSMPPAQLVRLRVRDALSSRGSVLTTAEGSAPWLLKLELDEFSQLFDSPTSSAGVVRLRATVLRAGTVVAQRSILARTSAPSQDAPGGVRALTLATDDAVAQLSAWLAQTMVQP